MPTEEHFRKLERVYAGARINEYFRPRLHIERGQAELAIDVDEKFFHAARAIHGSVYFKALDDAAFFAANSLVEGYFVLTVSFTLYFQRPVDSGTITATGRVTHASKRLYTAEAVLTDSTGAEVARGNGQFMPSRIRLTPEIGYE